MAQGCPTLLRPTHLLALIAVACSLTSQPSLSADVSLRDLVAALAAATDKNPINFTGKDLENLDLSNLDFKAARLDASNLFGVNLSSSDLRNVRLAGVTLDRAQLTNTNFTNADLSGATILIPAIHTSLTSNIWNAPTFRQSKLRGARLSGNFDGTDFGAADLTNVHFGTRSSLVRCEFSGANLVGAAFQQAQLTYARFIQADLRNSNFRDAKLVWVDFTDADLRGADLTGADLSMAILDGANLDGAKLEAVLGLESARGLPKQ